MGLGLEPWWERGLGLGLGLYNTNYSLSETRPLSGHSFKKEFGSPRRIGYFSHVTFFCGTFKPVKMVQTLSTGCSKKTLVSVQRLLEALKSELLIKVEWVLKNSGNFLDGALRFCLWTLTSVFSGIPCIIKSWVSFEKFRKFPVSTETLYFYPKMS